MLLRPPSLNDYPENQSVVISNESRQQSHKSSKNKRKQSSLSLNKNKSGNNQSSNEHLPSHEETKSIKSINSAASSKKNKKKQTSLHLNKQKQTTLNTRIANPFSNPKQQQLQRDFYDEYQRGYNKQMAVIDQSQVNSFRVASQFSPLPNGSPLGSKKQLYEKKEKKETAYQGPINTKKVEQPKYHDFQKLEPVKKISQGLLIPPKITQYVKEQKEKITLLNPFNSIEKELNANHFQQSQQFQDNIGKSRSRERKIFKQNKETASIKQSSRLEQTGNNEQYYRKNSKSRLGSLLRQSRQKKNAQSKAFAYGDNNTSNLINAQIAQRSRLEQSKMTRSRQKLKKIEMVYDQEDDEKFEFQSDLNLSQSNKLSHNRKSNNQATQIDKQKQSLHFQFEVEKSKKKGISLSSRNKGALPSQIHQNNPIIANSSQFPITPQILQSKPINPYQNKLPTIQIVESKPLDFPLYDRKLENNQKYSPQIFEYDKKQKLVVTPLILQSKPLQRVNSQEQQFQLLKVSQKLSSKPLPNAKHVQAIQLIKRNEAFFQKRQQNKTNQYIQIEKKPDHKVIINKQAKLQEHDNKAQKQQLPFKKKVNEVKSPDVYEYKQPTKQVSALYQFSQQQNVEYYHAVPQSKKQPKNIKHQIINQKHQLHSMKTQRIDDQRINKLQQAPSTFSKQLSNSSRSQSKSKKSNQKKKQSQIKIQKTKNTSLYNLSPRAQRSFYQDQNQSKNSQQDDAEKVKKLTNQEIPEIPDNRQKSNIIFFSDDENGKFASNQDIKSKTDNFFYEGNYARMPTSKPPLSRKSSDRSIQSNKSKKSKVKETSLHINKSNDAPNATSQEITTKNNNKIKKGSLMDLALRNKQSFKDSEDARSNSNASYQSKGSKYSRGGSSKSSSKKKQSVIKLKQNTLNPNLMPRRPSQNFNPSQTDPSFNKNMGLYQGIHEQPTRKIVTKDCYFIDQRGRLVKQDVIMDGNSIHGTSYQNTNYDQQVYERMKRASKQRRNSKQKRLQRSRSRSMSKKMRSTDLLNQTDKSFDNSFYENKPQIQTLRDYLIPTQQVPLRTNIPLLNKEPSASSKYYQRDSWQQPKKQTTYNQLFTKTRPKIERKQSRQQINSNKNTSQSKRTIPRTENSNHYRY